MGKELQKSPSTLDRSLSARLKPRKVLKKEREEGDGDGDGDGAPHMTRYLVVGGGIVGMFDGERM